MMNKKLPMITIKMSCHMPRYNQTDNHKMESGQSIWYGDHISCWDERVPIPILAWINWRLDPRILAQDHFLEKKIEHVFHCRGRGPVTFERPDIMPANAWKFHRKQYSKAKANSSGKKKRDLCASLIAGIRSVGEEAGFQWCTADQRANFH